MKEKNITLVFDVGRTHIKAFLFNFSGYILKEDIQNHKFIKKINKLNIIEVEKIFILICNQIKNFSKNFSIKKIIFTTHASVSIIHTNEKKDIYLPVIEYENVFDKKFEKYYLKNQKCNFSETLTPNLSEGLVLSKTIFFQIYKMKKKPNFIKSILFYPQYFAWKLSGIKSSEITYLGCHSDLWSFKKMNFSSFVYKNVLEKKIPKLYKSWDKLGKVKKTIVSKTKINKNCNIYCGLHDSSASYYLYEKKFKFSKSFTLISTGTWIVIYNKQMDLSLLNEKDEIFSKLNVNGKKIPVLRFMGGREFENIIKQKTDLIKSKKNYLDFFFKKKIFALPAFAKGGPFKNYKSKITNRNLIETKNDYINLASLYTALVTDCCLNRIGSKKDIVIDGGFVKNKFFLYYLSCLRKKQKIFINLDLNGTATGAFLLCNKNSDYKLNLKKLNKFNNTILAKYKDEWNKLISKNQ